jgi:hypothetical protein
VQWLSGHVSVVVYTAEFRLYLAGHHELQVFELGVTRLTNVRHGFNA